MDAKANKMNYRAYYNKEDGTQESIDFEHEKDNTKAGKRKLRAFAKGIIPQGTKLGPVHYNTRNENTVYQPH